MVDSRATDSICRVKSKGRGLQEERRQLTESGVVGCWGWSFFLGGGGGRGGGGGGMEEEGARETMKTSRLTENLSDKMIAMPAVASTGSWGSVFANYLQFLPCLRFN